MPSALPLSQQCVCVRCCDQGRAAHVAVTDYFPSNSTGLAVFNYGPAAVTATSAAVYGMGCGWTDTKPTPTI